MAQYTDFDRFAHKEATVAGWGRLWSQGPSPRKPYAPREVNLPVLPEVTCIKLEEGRVGSESICTQFDGKDACQVGSTHSTFILYQKFWGQFMKFMI